MLEGKLAVMWVVVIGAVIALVERLPPIFEAIVYAGAFIGAMKVVGGALAGTVRRGREVHEAVTSALPDRMDRVEERLEEGERHFGRIDAALETMANSERARVQGVLEGAARPVRPSRSTDPQPDEQRIWAFTPDDEL